MHQLRLWRRCWAFSAVEQIEAQLVFAGVESVELSTQQITSCTPAAYGCGGGDTTTAYEYLARSAGLAQEAWWPYTQGLLPRGECLDRRCTESCARDLSALAADFFYLGHYARVEGYSFAVLPCGPGSNCTSQDLEGLARVVEQTPVSICVNAANWDDYTGGVLTLDACGGFAYDDLDHCVQLVGYVR